jgi:hypothetical protein
MQIDIRTKNGAYLNRKEDEMRCNKTVREERNNSKGAKSHLVVCVFFILKLAGRGFGTI